MRLHSGSYVINHGAAPRGRGSWAFAMGLTAREADRIAADDPRIFWAPPGLTFGEARRAAAEEARRRGVADVAVMP